MADELQKIERDVVKRATGPWREEVQRVKELILLAYTPYMGAELTQEQATLITYQVLKILGTLRIDPQMDFVILQAIYEAHEIGRKIALRGSDRDEIPPTVASPDSERAVLGMADRAQETISRSRENLEDAIAVSTLDGLVGALKPVFDSPVQVERATTWALNSAKNKAIADVAQQTGERLCWVPERASCLHCAALAGVFAGPEGFPKASTFLEKPLDTKGFLFCPPRHPNCRCDVELNISPEYAQALKREAVREVLKGTALASDLDKLRAAKKLLAENPAAPASVKKYSRDMIKDYTDKKKAGTK